MRIKCWKTHIEHKWKKIDSLKSERRLFRRRPIHYESHDGRCDRIYPYVLTSYINWLFRNSNITSFPFRLHLHSKFVFSPLFVQQVFLPEIFYSIWHPQLLLSPSKRTRTYFYSVMAVDTQPSNVNCVLQLIYILLRFTLISYSLLLLGKYVQHGSTRISTNRQNYTTAAMHNTATEKFIPYASSDCDDGDNVRTIVHISPLRSIYYGMYAYGVCDALFNTRELRSPKHMMMIIGCSRYSPTLQYILIFTSRCNEKMKQHVMLYTRLGYVPFK